MACISIHWASRLNVSSNVTYDGSPYIISQDTGPEGITFNSDGTRFYISGSSTDNLYQYSLTTPYETRSGVTYDGTAVVSGDGLNPTGLAFNLDGTKLFVVNQGDDEVNQYSVTTPFDITSGAYTGRIV